MADDKLNQIVADAVGRTFQEWARQHPSLAAVIDQLRLFEQTAEALRETAAYRQAVDDYYRDRSELNLLSQLLELAGPILHGILGI